MTKESIKESTKKALQEKPDCTALAVSMETVTTIHELLNGDPDYLFCDDDTEGFQSKLFGKPLIVAENLTDGLIVPVNIGEAEIKEHD